MHHRGVTHLATGDLHAGLDHVRSAPKDDGVVELIVRRPAENEREVVGEAHLDCTDGLVGDTWNVRVSKRTGVGPDSERQLTLMNARAAALVAGCAQRERPTFPTESPGNSAGPKIEILQPEAPDTTVVEGDLVFVDGRASDPDGVDTVYFAKFRARFGADALRFVNSEVGRELNLRGINAKVVVAGTVRPGDAVRKL